MTRLLPASRGSPGDPPQLRLGCPPECALWSESTNEQTQSRSDTRSLWMKESAMPKTGPPYSVEFRQPAISIRSRAPCDFFLEKARAGGLVMTRLLV